MALMKKKKDREANIPDAGMSDIVFLLLLFFLVSTTIDVDTGIGLTLPEPVNAEDTFIPISKDRMAALLVNENGDVLLNKKVIAIPQIKETLKQRIREKIDLPKKSKLVVSVKTDRRTNYNLYIQALDQVKGAYFETRDEYALATYGAELRDLTQDVQDDIKKNKIPMIISIAEPEKI